jgi:hypothetical protein
MEATNRAAPCTTNLALIFLYLNFSIVFPVNRLDAGESAGLFGSVQRYFFESREYASP